MLLMLSFSYPFFNYTYYVKKINKNPVKVFNKEVGKMKDFILKMQEEKVKCQKIKKMQGKYDRFRCVFLYIRMLKNYDKIGE